MLLYISRTLNPPEKNYSTTEKELLAIIWAIKRLRQYLLGRKFIIQTDHQALKWLKNCKDPSSRLMRWRLRLEEYDYEIEYKKGKENKAADALSRIYPLTLFEEIEELMDTDSLNSDNTNLSIFEDYQQWKENPSVNENPIIQKTNRESFIQLNLEMLGKYNEKTWLDTLNNLIQNCTKTEISIGINDEQISSLNKVNIQLMLRFLATKYSKIKINFASESPKENIQIRRDKLF